MREQAVVYHSVGLCARQSIIAVGSGVWFEDQREQWGHADRGRVLKRPSERGRLAASLRENRARLAGFFFKLKLERCDATRVLKKITESGRGQNRSRRDTAAREPEKLLKCVVLMDTGRNQTRVRVAARVDGYAQCSVLARNMRVAHIVREGRHTPTLEPPKGASPGEMWVFYCKDTKLEHAHRLLTEECGLARAWAIMGKTTSRRRMIGSARGSAASWGSAATGVPQPWRLTTVFSC